MILTVTDDDNERHEIVMETTKLKAERPWMKLYFGVVGRSWQPKELSLREDTEEE